MAARVKPLRLLFLFLLLLGGLLTVVTVVVVQPLVLARQPSALGQRADPVRLLAHVRMLSGPLTPRDQAHPQSLDQVAAYLRKDLTSAGLLVTEQPFTANGKSYRNLLARLGHADGPRVVVGAHYDAYNRFPGADDNASGVAALLELGRLLAGLPLQRSVELVAYSLEEPPFFHTEHMGSAIHAASLRQAGTPVLAMISLETIGFFSDTPLSQRFPVPVLGAIYPRTGNFIAVIGRPQDLALVRRIKGAMKGASPLPVWSLCGPRELPGVDFSDQLNYWDQGYPAAMITDTAFYRNEHYHTAGDTVDTLDYARLAQVTQGALEAVLALAQ